MGVNKLGLASNSKREICSYISNRDEFSISHFQTDSLMNSADESRSIYILLGGNSREREISLQSGRTVARALQESGYDVTLIDPWKINLNEVNWKANSVAVIMLHGEFGEDGEVQAQLDALGITYTGSDAKASRLAFHKAAAKELFSKAGLKTPAWQLLNADASQTEVIATGNSLNGPVIVKPESQGSSLGVSVIKHQDQLWSAFNAAKQLDENILVETAIVGEEWTVAVIDNQPLPAIRISSENQFFDYSAKYIDNQTEYHIASAAESQTAQIVTDVSLQACRVLKTSGLCRVDLMVDQAGVAWLLEVNTIPGMTDHSLAPKAAASFGWTMNDLCKRILFSAFSHPHE